MSDESWDEQFKQFLRKKGEDFRRASEDVKAEAQRLLDSALDPQRQQRVRDRLNQLAEWARKAAGDVASRVEEVASKTEDAVQRAAEKVIEAKAKVTGAQRAGSPGPESPRPTRTAPRKAAGAAKKPAARSRRKKQRKP